MIKWEPENSINSQELELAAKKGAVTECHIIQEAERFYVTLRLSWRTEEIFLCTRRSRQQPRYFTDLNRLIALIRTKYSAITHIQLALTSKDSVKGSKDGF